MPTLPIRATMSPGRMPLRLAGDAVMMRLTTGRIATGSSSIPRAARTDNRSAKASAAAAAAAFEDSVRVSGSGGGAFSGGGESSGG